MGPPDGCDLLALWEAGSQRHPIDRALLLCGWARPQQPSEALADLPLGSLQRTLLELRAACYGPRIEAWTTCGACGSRQEFSLDIDALLAELSLVATPAAVRVGEQEFRLPTSRDLVAVSDQSDPRLAARQLLERCLLTPASAGDGIDPPPLAEAGHLEQVEAALEAADPAADIALALSCSDCGHGWSTSLDIGALLWEELTAQARALLLEVHALARSYGWSERQILDLTPWRRAAYLGLVEP